MTKDFKNFSNLWEEEISKIERKALNNNEANRILNDFQLNKYRLRFTMVNREYDRTISLFDNLESKLKIALATARSNYNLQNHSAWIRISESIVNIINSVANLFYSIGYMIHSR